MPSESQARLQRELAEDLRRLENRKQKRSLIELVGVNLCSNDYLGLATHPKLREAIVQAVQEAPRIGGTGSRLLSGHLAEWDVVEADFAQFARTEAALYFGSGYAANLGLLTSLVGRDDVVFSDARNHASLIDGMRLARAQKEIYRHLDLNSLEEALKKHAHARGRKVIVTESVFSMDGDSAPIAEIVKIEWPSGAVQELRNVSVNQTLTVVEPPKLAGAKQNALGFQSDVVGLPGSNYVIEFSRDLTEWAWLTTVTNSDRSTPFSDSIPLDAPRRFYRARSP